MVLLLRELIFGLLLLFFFALHFDCFALLLLFRARSLVALVSLFSVRACVHACVFFLDFYLLSIVLIWGLFVAPVVYAVNHIKHKERKMRDVQNYY